MTFKYIFCKDCGEKMHPDSRSCVCGWEKKADSQKKKNCSWSNYGKECPVTATVSDSGGRWFCTHHYPLKGEPDKANEMLNRILRGDIPKLEVNWREDFLKKAMEKSRREKDEKV